MLFRSHYLFATDERNSYETQSLLGYSGLVDAAANEYLRWLWVSSIAAGDSAKNSIRLFETTHLLWNPKQR